MKYNAHVRPIRSLFLTLIPVVAALVLPLSSQAATVLAVDFGGNNGNVQSGFQGFTNPADAGISTSQTYSGITVTVMGGVNPTDATKGYLNARDRAFAPVNLGEFTYSQLLRDRIVANGGSHGVLLTISGLQPNTEYTLQVWGYDTQAAGGAKPGTNILWDNTDGSDYELGRYTMTAGQLPTDNNSFSVKANITTDAAGTLMVRSYNPTGSTWIDGPGVMNGFVLSIVPEPSSALLGVAGTGLLLSQRRRRA